MQLLSQGRYKRLESRNLSCGRLPFSRSSVRSRCKGGLIMLQLLNSAAGVLGVGSESGELGSVLVGPRRNKEGIVASVSEIRSSPVAPISCV